MTTYATNNPRGSMDPKDLFDNAQNLDFAVNDITKAIWKDRFGRDRKTYWGMEQEFSAQLLSQKQTGEAQLQNQKEELDAQVLSQEQRFSYFIMNSGYKFVGEYTDGPLTITEYNQLIRYQNEFYKLTASTTLPFTTTGNDATSWANDSLHFVSVGDAALRQELSAPGGASLVGYSFNGAAYSVRTVLSKLRDSAANIEDFGAVGDGIADDTAAFKTANNLLQADTYIALSPGKSYKISGVTFTNKISLGCPNGRAKIISDTGVHWIIPTGDLDISIENIDIIPTLKPDINNKTTAVSIEVTQKNFGPGGFAVISGVRVKKGTTSGFYTGIAVKNQSVTLDGCEVVLRESHTNPAAKDGSIANWEVNSGDGILLDGTTYSYLRNCKVYYATNAFRSVGQIEDVHFYGCMALTNRRCFVFDSLSRPANQHRINNCHGSTYLCGIEMGDDTGRNVFCSIESSSIMVRQDASAEQIIFAKLYLDGANINNFQAYNDGTRGSNDIGIYLRTFDGVGTRRVMVSGLHCKGVGTGVYLDTSERNYISDVSMMQANMVGPAPKVYAYGPNNTSTPVISAYGFPDQENVFPAGMTAPRMMATDSIGLKDKNTISNEGAYQFRIRNVAGNFWIESADASGSLQHSVTVSQGGSLQTQGLYPLAGNKYTLGTPSLAWSGGYTQTALTVTSDERAKTVPEEITDAMLDAAAEVDWCMFQYLDRVEKKGADGARWHFGAIAQRFVEAFQKHGLDPFRFAFICYDEWDAEDEVVGEDGEIVSEAVSAGSRYGIRYEEALVLEAALQRRNYARLLADQETMAARIEKLESLLSKAN